MEALQAGKLAQARIELEKAVRERPDNAEARVQLGLLLGQLGDTQNASAAFEKALQLNPNSAEAHYNLGLTKIADRYGKVDWQGAIAEFRAAVQIRPDYAEAHHALGAGLIETGAVDAAIGEFRAAVAINARSPENHLDLGKALAQAGQQQAAVTEYQKALRLRPRYADAEAAWAKSLAAGGDRALGDAIEHFRRALKSNPDNLTAQYGLAQVLKRQGDENEANISFREARALSTRWEERVRCMRLSNEGLDAAHRGNRDAAVRTLRDAVELQPDVAVAHYNLGLVLADTGDLAGAVTQVVQAISLAPWESRFYVSLGRIWAREGDTAKARAAFQRACELDPANAAAGTELQRTGRGNTFTAGHDPFEYGASADTPDQHFAFATVLAKRGDWIGAAGEWLRVLALRPDDVDARNNLGVSYSHAGKDEKAELEFRKALQVSEGSPDAHFGLAVLALERKDNGEAVRELKQVIQVKPDYPGAHRLLLLASK
jgi:Flp pilus assembly protein TadD